MITAEAGIAIVTEAWHTATVRMQDRGDGSTFVGHAFASGIAAGTLGMVMAMFQHCDAPVWETIYHEHARLQTEFMGRFARALA